METRALSHYRDGIGHLGRESSHGEVPVAHLSYMIATGLEVPDPFSGHVQQGKD